MECGVHVKKWTACHPYPMDDTRLSNPNGPSPLKKAVHAMYDGGVSRHLTHDSCPLPPPLHRHRGPRDLTHADV